MSFKDNLLKKIEIEALAAKITASIGAPDSGSKIDRAAMRCLLDMTSFEVQKERDLELFVRSMADGKSQVLVLDNELALYQTTVDDVVLRKSPTVKEMISIRNAIKILNDKDVVASKRWETLTAVKAELIDALDLSFMKADVDAIIADGGASLKNVYGEGVAECLLLLSEILGYVKVPKALAVSHYHIYGELTQSEKGKKFGPSAVYDRIHNRLRWIDRRVDISVKRQVSEFRQEITSETSSDKEGEAVLMQLGELIQDTVVKNRK